MDAAHKVARDACPKEPYGYSIIRRKAIMLIYGRNFTVTARDVDPQNRVRADAIALMLQESAAHHVDTWGMSIPDLNRQGRTWVLARLAVDLGGRPGWKDELCVETWSRGYRGAIATRDFVVRRGDGGMVARATSVWFVIDLATRKPVRLAEYEPLCEHAPEKRSGAEEPGRIDFPGGDFTSRLLEVRAADLDLNGHVNNLRYLEWLYESANIDILATRRLSRIEIHFLSETHYPDRVELRAAKEPTSGDELGLVHSILRGDGVEAVRARSRWVSLGQEA